MKDDKQREWFNKGFEAGRNSHAFKQGFEFGLAEGERRIEMYLRNLASKKKYASTETMAQESYNEAWDEMLKGLASRAKRNRHAGKWRIEHENSSET